MNNKTIEFYNNNAVDFLRRTEKAEMHDLQDQFLGKLKVNATILDLGCGSGRDSLYFLNNGFDVTMVDASQAMCAAAGKLTGKTVINGDFLTFNADKKFDGVWACASLLHLKRTEIPEAILHFTPMLNDKAVIYLSFKYGDFEGECNGRYFTDLTEDSFKFILSEVNEKARELAPGRKFNIEKIFQTDDVRPDNNTRWLNIFLRYIMADLGWDESKFDKSADKKVPIKSADKK